MIQTFKRMLVAPLLLVCLIGWLSSPAVSAPTAAVTKVPVNNLIAAKPAPTYEEAILQPLYQAQAEAAAKKHLTAVKAANAEAQRLAEQKRVEQERKRALEMARKSVQPVQSIAPATGGVQCHDWMRQAGITDTANAYQLIMKESGCNPCSYNPGKSNCSLTASQVGNHACGIGQQLPCGKWKHAWNDPVGGMIDMQAYVVARYGSWANALIFHRSHNWY